MPRLIDKIIISQDHKTGTIYYTDNTMINLYHSENRVEDLIAIIYSPLSTIDTWASMVGSFQDTTEIDLDLLNKIA